MSLEDYRDALKAGQKEYRTRISKGQYPCLQVLDEVLRFTETQGEESLGLVNIPIDHIVGTKTAGRANAFAANFMPLLEENTEFAAKWASLAEAHREEGIRDPILAYEYQNRFYVAEGNKRVSVLRYFGAVSVTGQVRRVLAPQDSPEGRIYQAFLEFYRAARINCLWFSRPARFRALQEEWKGDTGPWSEEDRTGFLAAYYRFRRVFKALGGDKLPGTTADAFLACLRIHGAQVLADQSDAALKAGISKSWKELAAFSLPAPVELELAPEEPSRTLLSRILPVKKPETLRALFLYERAPESSAWTHAHDEGRRMAQDALGGRVAADYQANVSPADCAQRITEGIRQGYDLIFTTSPKLLPACLRAAAQYPEAKILNCSVYSPHPSIRSYYGRMFEVKFLCGMLAGALTQAHRVGYIADYPIYGAVAAVNAFALGVRMTDPFAQVYVCWRAQQEHGLWETLAEQGVDLISGQDAPSPVDPWRAHGLYRLADGVGRQAADVRWNWGAFYTRIFQQVLEGAWRDSARAINYWWGLSSGMVDLRVTDDVPEATARLLELVREDLIAGRFQPFAGTLTAQDGRIMHEGGAMHPDEIVKMDYLLENVIGSIPDTGELTPDGQELVQYQGVRRPEAVL